jgi:RNA polymerase sigma-70 factor (ECF subfamily)
MNAAEDRLFAEYQRSGDPAALGKVYDLVAPELLHVALHLADGPAAAEDLLQSTFVTAIERADSWDRSKRVLPWLVGILGMRAKTARRTAQRSPEPERLARGHVEDPLERAVSEELGERLDEAVHGLPEAYRSALILRLKHGLSVAEIAHALHRPPGTVRSQMARGLELLRKSLPAGLAGAALGVLSTPGRGLDAVREAIVSHATAAQVATGSALVTSSALGVLAMKKTLVAIGCAAVLGAGLWIWSEPAEPAAAVAPLASAPAAMPQLEVPEPEPARAQGGVARRAVETPAVPVSTAPVVVEPQGEDTGELVVRVVWEGSGEPAADAVAIVRRFAQDLPYLDEEPMRTDASGELRARVPAGYTYVRLLRGGEQGLHVPAGEVVELELTMFEGVTVFGTVTDADGRPVPHADLWVSLRWQPGIGHVAERADAEGRFRLRGISRWHWIGARASGFAPSFVQKVPGEKGDEIELDIVLDGHGRTARGRVVDRSGAAIPFARVLIGSDEVEWGARLVDGMNTPDAPPLRLVADGEGRFETEHVRPGPIVVSARAPGFGASTREVELAEGRELVLTLEPEAVVTGRIMDARGDAMDGVVRTPRLDRFDSAFSTSLGKGRYRLSGLSAGEVEIEAFHPDHGRVSTTLTLTPGEEREWNPVLRPFLVIRGRVLDPVGEPLVGWNVSAFITGTVGERSHTNRTDDEGEFQLSDVPDVDHTVWVIPPKGFGEFPRLIRQNVRPGGGELVLQLDEKRMATGSIEGLVLAPDGAPAAGVKITVWHHEQRIWREFTADADTGKVLIDHVPPGTVELQIRPRDFPWVRLGDHDVEPGDARDFGTVVLAHPGHLAGTLRGGDDAHLDSLTFALVDETGLENGVIHRSGREFRSGPIATGDYTLMVRGDFVQSQRFAFTLPPGHEEQLDVTLAPAGLRRLYLEKPEHAPAVKWAWAYAMDTDGAVVWQQAGIRPVDGLLEARLSAVPGTYTVHLNTNGGLTAETQVTIDGLGEMPPQRVALYRSSEE